MKLRAFKAAMLAAGMIPGLAAAQFPGLSLASFTAGGTGLTPFYVLGFELGPWQDYLARQLTPVYLQDPALPPLHVSWMDAETVTILPAFAQRLVEEPVTWIRYEFDLQIMDTRLLPGYQQSFQAPGRGFERQLLTPGIFHQLDEQSVLGVEAILAYQSFGTSRLGLQALREPVPGYPGPQIYQPYQESGYGTGVRLNVRRELLDGVAIDAGYQSRIDMEEFAYYRGVYSSPADFDIPARASLGLALQANNSSWLSLSIERVLYSDVSAFPSRLLPDRFLSLLGDSTSPEFAWDDLTVYTVGWTWTNGEDVQWHVDISSRSTPSPTSRTLQRALSGDIADHAMLVGFSKRTGEFSRFNLNAAYAPADFLFGGNVLGVASEDLGLDLEVEAIWAWDF